MNPTFKMKAFHPFLKNFIGSYIKFPTLYVVSYLKKKLYRFTKIFMIKSYIAKGNITFDRIYVHMYHAFCDFRMNY